MKKAITLNPTENNFSGINWKNLFPNKSMIIAGSPKTKEDLAKRFAKMINEPEKFEKIEGGRRKNCLSLEEVVMRLVEVSCEEAVKNDRKAYKLSTVKVKKGGSSNEDCNSRNRIKRIDNKILKERRKELKEKCMKIIDYMKNNGYKYSRIEKELGLKVNTIYRFVNAENIHMNSKMVQKLLAYGEENNI